MNSKLLFLTIIILQFYFINSLDLKDNIIGIDFGNTYSSVAIVQEGQLIIIPNEYGNTETPSVVSFAEDKIFVGEQAIHQYQNNPSRSVQKIKKLIAQDQKDIVLQNSQDFLSQNITKNNTISEIIDKEGSEAHTTEEVTAKILSKMKQIAENFLGTEIKYAILSIPAYLSYSQKQSIVNAASIAGLEVQFVLNDYKAAIHSYDLEDQNDKNALVFHLGGATMEVSILNIDEGVIDNIASCSDINFGGEVFDQRVVEYFIKLILQKYGKDISIDQIALQKLRIEVEAAKKQLSSLLKSQIKIQNLVDGLDFSEELTREKFEEINTDLFQKVTNTIQEVLNQSGLNKIDIDNIILIGGSTYIPKIRKSIQEFFGKEPKVSIKPNEVVAIGLASKINSIYNRDNYLCSMCLYNSHISLGIEMDDGVMSILIPRDSYLPSQRTKKFIFNQDNQQQKLRLKFFQGERLLTKDNFFIDELELKIPQIQQGKIEVEITAQMICDGTVQVTAVEKSTNVMNSITFESIPIEFGTLDFEENINYEAMLFQFKDQITKENIQSKKSLKTYLNFVKSILDTEEQKHVYKISNCDKKIINQTIKEIQNWLTTNPEADKTEYELRKKIQKKDLKDHIAIDFGNTYSSVVIVQGGKVIIIPNEFGNTETPSVVSFAEDKIFVGEQAIHQYKNNPSRSVQKIKKLIAQDQKDIVLQNSQDFLSQNITKNNRIYDIIDIEGSEVHKTEEVTAMILSKMKQIAENFLGNEIKYAILSFPTYLSDAQKQTMVNAASIAGLEVKRFFNDYKAAIHSYDLEDQNDKNALVFHLGGATMEVSILNIDYGVIDNIASCSDINFGGEVFDQRVVEYFIKLILQKYGKDISIDQIAIQKLRIEVEAAKKQLSSLLKTQIKIQNLVDGLDFSEELTREKFEEINTDLFQKVTNTIQDVLNKSGLNKIDIDNIILIGGSTYIPKIRKSIQEFFGKEPKVSIKPNEAVAIGLASQFDVIQYKNDLEILLQFEVNPISLGIETDDGIMSILIPKQSYLPYKKTEKFIFNQDNQQQKLRLKIFQGERLLTKDNFFIDELELKIPQIQQGKIEVEITAQIEWMGGLVNITAVEKSTNVMNSITFQSNPIKPEIQAFEDLNYEAMLFQFKDQITKEKINSKNSLKSYLDFVVGLLDTEEYKDVDKISNYDKQNIQQTIKEIQNWLSTNPEADKTEYELRKSNLENIFKPIFSKTQQNNEDLEYQLQQQKIFDL